MRSFWIVLLGAVLLAGCSGDAPESGPTTTTVLRSAARPPAATITPNPDPCPDPWCIRYHIHPDAIWSDGTPVTAVDFVYTHDLLVAAPAGSDLGVGHDEALSVRAVGEKTLLMGFAEPYGRWRKLFGVVLPAHIGDPSDLGVTASAFRLDEPTVEGVRLARNTNYWSDSDPLSGEPAGDVGAVEFVVVPGVRDRIEALDDRELDIIDPRPLDWIIEEVSQMEGVTSVAYPGPFWDHIDFNHDDPLLSRGWVREAIAMAIDRESILDATIRTLRPAATGLGNTVWMPQAWAYQDHYDVPFDPVAAERLLAKNGCAAGNDGVYVCDGTPMSFVWATTAGDEFRETQAEMAQGQLEEVGIELILDYRIPSDLFAESVLFAGPEVWQMINFSWRADADPHGANTTYYCEGAAPNGFGALNVNRYCNPEVEALVRATDTEPDAARRSAAYNEADRLYLGDLALIPLYQKAAFLAWNSALAGPAPNMLAESAMWNIVSWTGLDTVRFGVESIPAELDPLAARTEEASLVLAAVTSGAFGVTPEFEYRPVLIETAELVFEGG